MKNTKSKKSFLPVGAAEGIVTLCILFVVILIVVVLRTVNYIEEAPESAMESVSAESIHYEILSPDIILPVHLADQLTLTGLYAADALFPEDGSNTAHENLLCAVVKNESDKTLEYMTFTLTCGTETYEFSVATLPPSAEVYAFEKNAAQAPDEITELTAECSVNLFFDEEPTLMEDQVEFTVYDGSIDVTNITDTPTDREIQVYYKNTENLAYFGGITYFLRVPAGLAPGESYNGYAPNASKARTEVMFVKYGN